MGCKVKELSPVEFRFLMDPLDPQSGVPLMAVGSVEQRKTGAIKSYLLFIRFLMDPLEPQSGIPLMAAGSVECRKPRTIAIPLFQV